MACFGHSDQDRCIFPVTDLSRYIVVRLLTLIAEGKISNGYSSTLYGVEMHKIFLYLLRDKYLERSKENTFVFWSSETDIADILVEIDARNIDCKNGFFLKNVSRSQGGSAHDTVIYCKDTIELRSQLEKKSKDNAIYVIEQAYAHTKDFDGAPCVTSGRAFGVLTCSLDDGDVNIEVVDAQHMFAVKPYLGKEEGSRDQFVANAKSSRKMVSLSEYEKESLSKGLNDDGYKSIWRGLCQDKDSLAEEFLENPFYGYFLGTISANAFYHYMVGLEKFAKLDKSDVSPIPIAALLSLHDSLTRFFDKQTISIDCCEAYLNDAIVRPQDFKKKKFRIISSLSMSRALFNTITALLSSDMLDGIMVSGYSIDFLRRHISSFLNQQIDIERVNHLLSKSVDSHLMCAFSDDLKMVWSRYDSSFDSRILQIKGIHPKYHVKDRNIALQQAALFSDFQTLRILVLGRFADVDALNKTGWNALSVALRAQKTETIDSSIQILIEATKEKIVNWTPATCLEIVANMDGDDDQEKANEHYLEICRLYFLQQLLEDIELIGHFDQKLEELIRSKELTVEACEEGIREHLSAYLKLQGKKYKGEYEQENLDRTLRQAVYFSDIPTVTLLMYARLADPRSVSDTGMTALQHANNKRSGPMKDIVNDYCDYHQNLDVRGASAESPEVSAPGVNSLFLSEPHHLPKDTCASNQK